MKILYHAINGTGLGHMIRLSTIACSIKEKRPDIQHFFATNSGFVQYLKSLRFPFIHLPSDFVITPGGMVKEQEQFLSRKNAIKLYNIIKDQNPDLIVFDTHFSPTLVRQLMAEGKSVVLVLRECRKEYLRTKIEDGIFKYFKRILIPHDREIFRRTLSWELLEILESLAGLRYIGPVVRNVKYESKKIQDLMSRHQIDEGSRLILITCGGGGYISQCQQFLERACIAVKNLKQKDSSIQELVFTGPFLPSSQLNFPSINWEAELPLLMKTAHLIVAHGGYNTVHEILASGTPAVVVQMYRRNENQGNRIQELALEGRILALDLDSTIPQYTSCFQEVIGLPRFEPKIFLGADLAANELLALL